MLDIVSSKITYYIDTFGPVIAMLFIAFIMAVICICIFSAIQDIVSIYKRDIKLNIYRVIIYIGMQICTAFLVCFMAFILVSGVISFCGFKGFMFNMSLVIIILTLLYILTFAEKFNKEFLIK